MNASSTRSASVAATSSNALGLGRGDVVERARARLRRAGWRNVHVARGDATRLPLGVGRPADETPPGEVDAVLATFVTGMLPDPAGAVDDWCRLVADTNAERSEPGPITDRANQTGRTTRGRICVAGLVRLATPPTGDGDRDRPGSPVDLLDNRALVAHRRVHDRCSDATTTRHVAGFAWVTAGTVGPETTDAESDRREPNGSAGPVDEA